MTKQLLIALIAVSSSFISCSDKKNGDPGGAPADPTPTTASCSDDGEAALNVNDGEDTTPTWATLDCYAARVSRKSLPSFLATFNYHQPSYVEDRSIRNMGYRLYKDADTENGTLPGNRAIWNSLNQGPPYVELSTSTVYTFPLKAEWLEYKLRWASMVGLAQKLKGRFFTAVLFYPPSLSASTYAPSLAAFKTWIAGDFLKEKISEAKAMERIKTDAYTPFPLELEAWIETMPFASSTSVTDKVALAQWVSDTVIAAVREHYKGVVMASSYINFELKGTEWNKMNYSKYDVVLFTLVPLCAGTAIDQYLTTQFINQLQVVSNSGNMKWGIGEVYINPKFWVDNGCMTEADYKPLELSMFEKIIAKINAASPAPIMAQFDNLYKNDATKTLVSDYVKSKAKD